MRYGEFDPSYSNRRRSGAVAAGVAIALALASCTTGSSEPIPKREVVLESIPTLEQAREELNRDVQKTAEYLAAQILQRPGGKDTRLEVTQSLGLPERHDFSVSIDADTLVGGGDRGEYYLSATLQRDAEGNFGPSTVDKIYIGMGTRRYGEQDDDKGDLYKIMMFKINNENGEDNWRIVSSAVDKSGGRILEHYSTELEPVMILPPLDQMDDVKLPLTPAIFEELLDQANTIWGWSYKAAPVNYAPSS